MTKIETASIMTQLSLQSDIISNQSLARRFIISDMDKVRALMTVIYRDESEESRKLKHDDPNRTFSMSKAQFEAIQSLLSGVCSPSSVSQSIIHGYDKDTEIKTKILQSLST